MSCMVSAIFFSGIVIDMFDSVKFDPQPYHNLRGGAGLVDSLLQSEVPERGAHAVEIIGCLSNIAGLIRDISQTA